MSGKCRPSLRAKTLENVKRSKLSVADKDCIQAVFERFIPKKVVKHNGSELYHCPNCDTYFLGNGFKHCTDCGQALDWSDTE